MFFLIVNASRSVSRRVSRRVSMGSVSMGSVSMRSVSMSVSRRSVEHVNRIFPQKEKAKVRGGKTERKRRKIEREKKVGNTYGETHFQPKKMSRVTTLPYLIC